MMSKISVKMSRKLLSSLISVWVKSGGFIISNKVVRLSLLDVCLGLELWVVGDSTNLDDVFVERKCKKLLNNKIVDVEYVCTPL